MKKQKISPLKGKPLRYTGQSLDERIDYLINDELLLYLIATAFAVGLACYEWFRYYFNIPPSPKGITFLAIIMVLFCSYKFIKIRKMVKQLKLGRDGERAVGQFLERLREKGYKVFHDIIGDNFNIDHVIVSKHGIFLIETKTLNKIPNKDSKLYFDGNKIYIDKIELKKNPLPQVSASSFWLKNTIKETTGKDFKVKPAVVFPGWFVETSEQAKKTAACWVLNPRALPTFIENENEVITQEDVALIAYHLSRYIMVKEDNAHTIMWNEE